MLVSPSHWVPLSYGLVPHLSKKLSKFPNACLLESQQTKERERQTDRQRINKFIVFEWVSQNTRNSLLLYMSDIFRLSPPQHKSSIGFRVLAINFLIILANFNTAVVLIATILPLTSSSIKLFSRPFDTALYSPVTRRIVSFSLVLGLGVHCFRFTRRYLIIDVHKTRAKFLELSDYSKVMN